MELTNELAELEGSDKQVSWAEDIRERTIENTKEFYADFDWEYGDWDEDEIEPVINYILENLTDAGTWIDLFSYEDDAGLDHSSMKFMRYAINSDDSEEFLDSHYIN